MCYIGVILARSSLRWLNLDLSYSLHCLKGVICIGDYIGDYYTGSRGGY